MNENNLKNYYQTHSGIASSLSQWGHNIWNCGQVMMFLMLFGRLAEDRIEWCSSCRTGVKYFEKCRVKQLHESYKAQLCCSKSKIQTALLWIAHWIVQPLQTAQQPSEVTREKGDMSYPTPAAQTIMILTCMCYGTVLK